MGFIRGFRIRGFILFLILFHAFRVQGQNARNLQFIKPDNGLSHRNVNCILQDRQGYMWFGTENGLNRYDGTRFLALNMHSDVCQLIGNVIWELFEDRKGRIWVATNKGLDLLDPVKLTVTHLTINMKDKTEPESGGVSAIAEDAEGKVWIGTRSGMIQRYDGGGIFTTIRSYRMVSPPFENIFIQRLTFDKEDNLWFSYRAGGAVKMDKTGKILRQYPLTFATIMEGPFITKSGRVLVPLDNGLYEYAAAKDAFVKDNDPAIQNSTRIWLEDSNGEQWLSLGFKRLFHLSEGRWREETDVINGLRERDAEIQCLYEDRSHNLWIGTNYGIVKTPLRKQEFINYLSFTRYDLEGARYSIRGMLEDTDGSIWIGSYGHLHRLIPKTGEIQSVPMPDHFFTDTASINPYALVREGKYIWMATEGNGLVRFDPKTKVFRFFEYFNYSEYLTAPRFMVSMIGDGKGRLWMGTYFGLYFKAAGKDSFFAYNDIFPGTSLDKTLVLALKKGRDGEIWAGTEQGLFCLDEKTLQIKKHYKSFGEGQTQTSTILSIAFDEKGMMWLGTKGGGLVRFDPKTDRSVIWTTNEGISDNIVYASIVDGEHIWASTHNGLNYFNPRTGKFFHFFSEDGLSDNEFNHGAILQTKSGDLYFGGINGINRFNPEKMRLSGGAVLPLILTQIDRYDPGTGAVQTGYANLANIKTIRLPYDNRYLNVYFALTDYARPDKNTYRYILEGYDTKWHNLGNQNYISMLGIPAGKYLLRIQATGSNGLPNPTELHIPIIAEEVFYKTWLFISLLVLFILGLVASLYFYRIRQYKKLMSLRTQIASDLHDEVGSHLTRIAISSDLMKDSPDNRVDALIDHIADSSRQAVATMSDVIWSIDTRSDSMGSLLDRMREHARNIFEPAGINFTLEAKNLSENDRLHMDQRHDLYLIFKEATNNIVKHSDATEAKIELENKQGHLQLKISDNGTVAPNPNRSTGMGLRNMHMRAKRMKGELKHEYNKGFTVWFKGKART